MPPTPARAAAALLAALLACAALAPPRLAAQADTLVARMTPEGAVLNFQEADLRFVLATVAEMAGLNVTFGALPGTAVTLRTATPVPRDRLRGTFDALVSGNGLRVVEQGGLLRIEQVPQTAPAPAAEPPGPRRGGRAGAGGEPQLFVYRLRHAKAEEVAGTLREVFGLGARTGAETRERPTSLSQQLNAPRISLPGEEPEVVVAGVAPRAVGSGRAGDVQVVPDESTNSLLIRGSEDAYETIMAAVRELDVRPLQVLIEALVVEVTHTRDDNLGVDVHVPDQGVPGRGVVIGGDVVDDTPGNIALRVLQLGGVRAEVIIRALAASSDATVISRPVVLAQNNKQARLLIGDQRPFVQISRALPTDSPVRDEVIQYRDVGTELTITPTVNPDGYVTMAVLQEVSTVSGETQYGPVISTREAQTELMVRDRHTVVLGGLIGRERRDTETGIPLLRDLPLVGRLFRSTQRARVNTELFILLTPHVLRTDEDVESATRAVEEGTREVGRVIEKYEPLTGAERVPVPKPEP